MSKKSRALEGLTRREFLKRVSYASLRTAGVVAINVGASEVQGLIRGKSWGDNSGGNYYGNEPFPSSLHLNQTVSSLEVKDFSLEIYHAAFKSISPSNKTIPAAIGGFFAGDFVGGLVLRNKATSLKKKVGAGSAITGKIMDYLSTYYATRHTQDPRFHEYGFTNYFYEVNPFHSLHPSGSELLTRGSILTLISGVVGHIFPPFGRGYLGAVSAIANNNVGVGNVISLSLDIGDEVKSMIEKGKNELAIYHYLGNYEKG